MTGSYAPIKEVADHFAVSVSTLRNWIRTGVIPASTYIKINETYRFNVGLVEEALLNASTTKEESTTYNVEENDT